MKERPPYPDIGDIIARKAKGRIERARLSFGEKLDILDKLRNDVARIVQARQARSPHDNERQDSDKHDSWSATNSPRG